MGDSIMPKSEQSGPENFKKILGKKNSWNQINQFHEKIFF